MTDRTAILPRTGRDTAPTDKQTAYLARLAAERGLPTPDVRDRWEASAAIDDMMKIRPAPKAPTAGPAVADGRYALLGLDDVVRFYVVRSPAEGRWQGWTFVDAMASDDRWPIKNRDEKARILAAIAADPMGALARFGREIGSCGHCGRTLTDEESRARGIGPVCFARLAG
jgi:hypothetical protein